jgi:hypothetical protein
MPEITGVQLDADNCIDCDLLCSDCAYNLRMCQLDGACPECGASIAGSIEHKNPYSADPAWLYRLLLGGGWIVVACAIAICQFLWFAIGGEASSSGSTTENYSFASVLVIFGVIATYSTLVYRVLRFTLTAACVMTLYSTVTVVVLWLWFFGNLGTLATPHFYIFSFVMGYWLVTTHEPQQQVCTHDSWITFVTRFGVIAWGATAIGYFYIVARIGYWMGIWLYLASYVAANIAVCIRLIVLCERQGAERLVQPLRWLIGLVLLCGLFGAIKTWLWYYMNTWYDSWEIPLWWTQTVIEVITHGTQLIVIAILAHHWLCIRRSILAVRSEPGGADVQTSSSVWYKTSVKAG